MQRGIQNAAKHLKWSRKEHLAKIYYGRELFPKDNFQFVWQECKFRRTFEYLWVLNMAQIMNMAGF